jgi:RNA polymerase sigma factor (sigma-70 family)
LCIPGWQELLKLWSSSANTSAPRDNGRADNITCLCPMPNNWQPSPDDFTLFLRWLDPDVEKAAQRYESIRRNLITIFTRRGCHRSEELADETFNRVMRRLPQMVDTYEGEPVRYMVVVARNLHLEYVKESERLETLPEHDHTDLSVEQPDDSKEHEFACLEQCLRQLSAQQRKLVVDYYQESKRAKIDHRKQMADQMGIGLNALRIRAHRIRAGLEECLKNCLR